MNKSPDPGEVVRDKIIPAAEELVASLAERVGPFAKEAVEQVTPVAHAAAERTVALTHVAAEKVGPLAQQTRDAVAPYAQQAADAVSPYTHQVGPFAQQAAGAVAPYAALLAQQSRKTGHDLADRLEPAMGVARDAFSGAKGRLGADRHSGGGDNALAPSVTADPVVVLPASRKKRGWFRTLALVAAASGATYVVVRKLVGDKGSQWQTARPSTAYTSPTSAPTAGGATATSDAATDQQAGPSAHDLYRAADGAAEPDQPAEGGETEVVASTTSLYGTVGSDEADPSAVVDTDESAIAARTEEIDDVADVDAGTAASSAPDGPTGSSARTGSSGRTAGAGGGAGGEGAASPYPDEHLEEELETVEERAYEEPEDAVRIEQDTATGGGPDAHPERYDLPGTYVGVEPPEGYTIKGNERSMKYHVPDSNSYGRTIAEVWFDSEESARRAGFTRAQH